MSASVSGTYGLVPGDWAKDATCAQTDPDLWFPVQGGLSVEAKAICRRCPVLAECHEYAVAAPDVYGVMAGMGPAARRRERERRGAA